MTIHELYTRAQAIQGWAVETRRALHRIPEHGFEEYKTQAAITGALEAFGENVDANDSLLVVLPLFHAFSFCTNFVLGLYRGVKMYFVRSLYTIGEDVKMLQPTVVLAVPLLAEKIYDRIDAKLKESKAAKILIVDRKLGLLILICLSHFGNI